MEILARPNLNGNTEADFLDAARDLLAAAKAADKALANIRANVIHGRNYQTIADVWARDDARSNDVDNVNAATEAMGVLMDLVDAIAAATWEE